MSKQVTILLDSGCFLTNEQKSPPYYSEIGYFQSDDEKSDIRVCIDGVMNLSPKHLKLGGNNCSLEVRIRSADNSIKRDGVEFSTFFHEQILHLKSLYGEHVQVDRDKFDCVIRFDCGRFSPSMVKKRAFKRYKAQGDGTYAYDVT